MSLKKKKVIKEKIAKDKPKRKLIASTVGKLSSVSRVMAQSSVNMPSVSKVMPQVASAVPLVSKEIPLVSKTLPQASAKPTHTLAKKWELPSKHWGTSKVRPTRSREVTRPQDIGLFTFLGKVITAPMQPIEMIKQLTSAINVQIEEEKGDPKLVLEQGLLELKMRREMNEISEQNYEILETKLKKRIKDLRVKGEVTEKTKEVKKKRR